MYTEALHEATSEAVYLSDLLYEDEGCVILHKDASLVEERNILSIDLQVVHLPQEREGGVWREGAGVGDILCYVVWHSLIGRRL